MPGDKKVAGKAKRSGVAQKTGAAQKIAVAHQSRKSSGKKPSHRQTLAELRALQTFTGRAIFRPLTEDFAMNPVWKDGRATADVIAKVIKPNDRLTSFERLELYNKQYWFRLIDNLYSDFPGLLAILGQEKFSPMVRAYLAKYPSRSFTLRNLGRHMPQFIEDEPNWAGPRQVMARDMAKFEWAQIVAFDGPAKPPIAMEDLAVGDPSQIRLGLQPYITLLDLAYPLDKFVLALKRSGHQGGASNAVGDQPQSQKQRKIALPRRGRTLVAVHRHHNDLYYYRLEPAAFNLLTALSQGCSLLQACERAGTGITPRKLKTWFGNFSALGWFCKP